MRRSAFTLLKEYLRYFPCVAIVGARQTGKTTLLKELSSPWKRFDLEKASDFQLIARDPELFFRMNFRFAALDEVQFYPPLFQALRVAIDDDRKRKGRFVITGSSSPELVKSISESLAGRVGVIELSPFSFEEVAPKKESLFFDILALEKNLLRDYRTLKPRGDLAHIHDYWFRGGFPEPWLTRKKRFWNVWMEHYVHTYLDRDLIRLFPGLDKNRYRLFLQLLANLSGTIVNYSEVARSLGVSQPTVRDYFHIADGTYLWRNIPPYEKNVIKRIIKHPKGYVRDTGLLHYLLRIYDLDFLLSHPQMGRSWEGMVIEQIIRGLKVRGVSFDFFYYRTGAGAEIDLILEGSMGLVPIEIKYTTTLPSKGLRALQDFMEEHACSYGIVINNDEVPRLYDKKIIGIPFSYL